MSTPETEETIAKRLSDAAEEAMRIKRLAGEASRYVVEDANTIIKNFTMKHVEPSIPIYALSDIHADINSLIISLRDCAKVIRHRVFPNLINSTTNKLDAEISLNYNNYMENMLKFDIWDTNYLFDSNNEIKASYNDYVYNWIDRSYSNNNASHANIANICIYWSCTNN